MSRYALSRERLSKGLLESITRMWATLDVYDPRSVDQFSMKAALQTEAAQSQVARATEAYLRSAMQLMNIPQRTMRDRTLNREALRTTPLAEAYKRPAETVRYLQAVEKPNANERGLRRIQVMADTDLTLAMRESARSTLAPVEAITGYRRIIHPELSRDGSCGLCVVASDRKYHRGDLLDIHEGCHCTVLPIVGESDPGLSLNAEDLAALYKAAGDSTSGDDLRRVRVKTEIHGDIGPVLVNADHVFSSRPAA